MPMIQELDQLDIREVLDADSRPTLVIDLDPDQENPDGITTLEPVFCNAALRQHERLFDCIIGPDAQGFEGGSPIPEGSGIGDGAQFDDFKRWATGVTTHDDSRDVFPLTFLYGNFAWTGSTVRQRWRLISGNRLWHIKAQPQGDLSAGVPPEVATGGVRAEQAVVLRKKTPTTTLPSPPPTTSRTTLAEAAAPNSAAVVAATTAMSAAATVAEPPPSDAASSTLAASTQPTKPYTNAGSSDDTKTSSQSASILLSLPEKAVADWTVPNPVGILSPHLQYARTVNWARTPLGPMDTWSPEFRQIANLCMSNPHPAALFWGSELTMLYNEAYANEVAGNKHPSLMGTGFSGPFSELWDYAGPVFAECARTGVSVRKENDYLPINRRNLLEETFFSWSFTPLYGGTKRILGFYNAPFETTDQVVTQRRMQTICKAGELTIRAKNIKEFWKAILAGLEDNHNDVPFALLYSVGDTEDVDHSSVSSGSTISLKTCHLEGSISVPDGHIAAPKSLDLKRSREGFVPAFREAMRTREPTLLHTRDGTLPEALLEGIEWRGFGDPCHEATILPVRPTNGDSVLAFLVLGINPRRRYDDKYKEFTSMLHRQLATSLASLILYEDEVRRNRDAAEAAVLEKERLTQQLALQDHRLRRMAELSPLGMFFISPEGVLREANDQFYEMTGHARDSESEMSWMDFIHESSIQTMKTGWHALVNDREAWSGELRLKSRPSGPVNLHGESIDPWILFIAHSEFGPDDDFRAVLGSIMDVSHHKWASDLQTRRLQEAEETRRQQNEFIDITSHEMRNPLSAILQCADDITATLAACKAAGQVTLMSAIEPCIEAAQTIALCVQHQKSIVDDILTISKLDSNLLQIIPSIARPDTVLRRALKMFESEFQGKGIEIKYDKDSSYDELAVDWVTLDPSRVLQILINLMTNAIKFTAPSSVRVITVAVGASLEPPSGKCLSGFDYAPVRAELSQVPLTGDWGTGEVVYIYYKVQDTGCGLSPSEKQMLFQRFKQASPRTHAQYGGSGLGLFISKHLTELHGGLIGVASETDKGSVFAFYVRAQRSGPPRHTQPVQPLPIQPSLESDSAAAAAAAVAAAAQAAAAPYQQDMKTASLVTTLATNNTQSLLDPREMHVLVVEDNLINQRVLVGQLRKIGCPVHVANDGIEALEFLYKTHFCRPDGCDLSIILMDLEMPNMDGLTCVRRIREMQKEGTISRHIPVIAVTANVRDEQVAAAKLNGMDDVVPKPFRIPDLLKKIETLLVDGGDDVI